MVAQGTTLAGRYRLDDRLGAGGMGEVWRGEDIVLARTVAVKVLLPDRMNDPGFAVRFQGEARAMATINHPGVVDVYDYGVTDVPGDGPTAFLVMRFVDGEPLKRDDADRDDEAHPHRPHRPGAGDGADRAGRRGDAGGA